MIYKGIAISGKAGSGKSTLAREIIEDEFRHIRREAAKVSFADPIKKEVFELYGVTKEMPGGRQTLIEHGEARRALDPLYWVKQAEKLADSYRADGIFPVFDDLRFAPEMQWVLSYPLLTVRLEVPLDVLESRIHHPNRDDPTETDLDGDDRWNIVWYHPWNVGLAAHRIVREFVLGYRFGDAA